MNTKQEEKNEVGNLLAVADLLNAQSSSPITTNFFLNQVLHFES